MKLDKSLKWKLTGFLMPIYLYGAAMLIYLAKLQAFYVLDGKSYDENRMAGAIITVVICTLISLFLNCIIWLEE